MVTERDFDEVDEASAESFPASDPPSFTGLTAGAPAPEEPTSDPLEPVAWVRPVAIAAAACAAIALGVVLVTRSRRT